MNSLATVQHVMGLENGHTVSAMKELGALYVVTGRHEDGEKLLRRTLEISRKILGPRHIDTLQSAYWLAVVECDRGDLAEAERQQVEALALQREVLGDEHPDTLLSMGNLGRIRAKQGRHAEARGLLERAVEDQTRRYGAAHPHTAESLYGLACAAALRGDRTEAMERLREALQTGHVDPQRVLRESDLTALRSDGALHGLMAAADAAAR